ncbi:pantoate--beta-alanine ligase [Methylobacterium dankookense]|uniref:Pantothenate synthetase n=1 Tax=Methylobacterium dankookense TaxID=560405 RepID=A0A564FTM8_9HYPH|nr:pantoate--beta-alanine ligase [Methylobacterium dankookense]GJD55270.1 Pantothenate synthetase [Methylobacterium dankookense]VUF11509.1 Pantothenate synthetase [Methylobacterium dankookense]
MSSAQPSPSPQRISDIAEMRTQVAAWRASGERVALVPTMGALHEGHLALVAEARRIGRAVVSIFVNPTQFGPNEDFARYPRDVESDLRRLGAAGTDAAWTPEVATMYPPGFATRIEVSGLTEGLCGAFRPGHFSGVATVVTKLLGQVRPDVALFGEKDYQQLQVVRRAVEDLDLAVEIRGVPTLREADGLARSSRNRYLEPAERALAPNLHAVLSAVAAACRTGAATAPAIAEGIATLEEAGFQVQYLAVCDAATLAPLERVAGPARVLAAAYLGRTRLIDNVAV